MRQIVRQATALGRRSPEPGTAVWYVGNFTLEDGRLQQHSCDQLFDTHRKPDDSTDVRELQCSLMDRTASLRSKGSVPTSPRESQGAVAQALPVVDSVLAYEKIHRIGEGTYGVVYKGLGAPDALASAYCWPCA